VLKERESHANLKSASSSHLSGSDHLMSRDGLHSNHTEKDTPHDQVQEMKPAGTRHSWWFSFRCNNLVLVKEMDTGRVHRHQLDSGIYICSLWRNWEEGAEKIQEDPPGRWASKYCKSHRHPRYRSPKEREGMFNFFGPSIQMERNIRNGWIGYRLAVSFTLWFNFHCFVVWHCANITWYATPVKLFVVQRRCKTRLCKEGAIL